MEVKESHRTDPDREQHDSQVGKQVRECGDGQ